MVLLLGESPIRTPSSLGQTGAGNTAVHTRKGGGVFPRTTLCDVARYVIEKSAHTPAKPSAVYRLLRDGSTWPEWTAVDEFRLEREGDGEPEGVGAVRVFRSGRVTGRDEITGFEQDRQFRYVHLGGLPVKNYEAVIDLAAAGDGTDVTWRVTFDPKFPFTGMFVHKALTKFITINVEGLAKHAE